MRAYLDTKQFYAPSVGNYLEIYYQYVGHSLNYKRVNNGIQGEVKVALEIRSNDSIVRSDAYILQSPLFTDSIIDDFFDLRRYALKPGKYLLNIKIKDLNGNGKVINASQHLALEELGEGITFSDIETIEYGKKGVEESPFHKSGYYLLPRISTYFPEALNSIPVYLELYNSTILEDSVCGLKQTIVNMENGAELSELTVYNKIRTDEVVPIIRNVDISQVPSGKFSLTSLLVKLKKSQVPKMVLKKVQKKSRRLYQKP